MLPDTATGPLIHPRWVRVTHWINALAMFMMIGSGWQIYDASPLFSFIEFPRQIALGDWLAGALLWHFAAMWLLVINGLVYVTLGLATGRGQRPHQQRARTFGQRVDRDQPAQLTDQARPLAERQVSLDPVRLGTGAQLG